MGKVKAYRGKVFPKVSQNGGRVSYVDFNCNQFWVPAPETSANWYYRLGKKRDESKWKMDYELEELVESGKMEVVELDEK